MTAAATRTERDGGARAWSRALRPRIDTAAPLHEKADAAWAALVANNGPAEEPAVMVRGTALVRMADGVLESYGRHSLSERLSRVADFGTQTRNGWSSKDAPERVANLLLARAAYDDVPRVDRVVDVPVVTPAGELISRPGYHADAKIYYRPAPGLEDLDVPGHGSIEDVDQVVEARSLLLDDLLGDFAFADAASRAHALGLLLLPFVREYIGEHPTPMHGVFAPAPNTGKGYLAQAALIVGCGLVGMSPGAAGDDAEWRKVITSMLLAGRGAIILDNLHGTLNSAALAAALTTGEWNDRRLGGNEWLTLSIRNAWVATANNPQLSDEQVRRVVPIFLDPGDVPPGDRPRSAFRHPDLHGWALENRRNLVEAALVLVRHWLDGQAELVDGGHRFLRHSELHGGEPWPVHSRTTLGSFERYAGVVGGILEMADVRGFLENRDRLREEANVEHEQAAAFLAAWHALGEGPLTSGELAALCAIGGRLHDPVPDDVAEAGGATGRALGSWLRGNRGRPFGDYRVCKEAVGAGHNRWYVAKRDPSSAAAGGAPDTP